MKTMPLRSQITSVFELYGNRNAMYLRGDDRLKFLLESTGALAKHVRKEVKDKRVLAGAVASVFSRTCSFADSFVNLDVVTALQEKFPVAHCAYCQQAPCKCPKNRKTEIQYIPVSGEQEPWSVGDWCAHMDRMYGASNRANGIQFVLGRLYEEISEAVVAHFRKAHDPSLDLEKVRRELSLEFADVFAWTFSISVMLEVDIQPVLNQRYNGNCRRCDQRPCNCGHFSYSYLDGIGFDQTGKADSVPAG